MTPSWKGAAHYRNVFRSVDRATLNDVSEWPQITGGSVEFSAFSDTKVSGSLDFTGLEIPDSGKLVRIIQSFETGSGEKVERPVATMLFSISNPTYRGPMVRGTMECRSVLSLLASKRHGAPFIIEAGTNAVGLAKELAESLGLIVTATPSEYTVRGCITVKREDASYLAIVNKLLSLAGYSSAWVNACGEVQMTPYVEPVERAPSVALSDSEGSIMYPELVKRSEWADTPNVVKLCYETDTELLVASASNIDPTHPASLVSRGYEVTYDEAVTELEGATAEERLANLEEMARGMLLDKSSDIEYVDGACQYVDGLSPNNAISIDYARADIKWTGALTNVKLKLSKTMKADYSARRFVRHDLAIETSSEIIWEVSAV